MLIASLDFLLALIQPVLSLKNGLELIITFLILLQLIYLAFKVQKSRIFWSHICFLVTLLLHFTILNVNHYFGVLLFQPFFFYPFYGFSLMLTANLLVPTRYESKALLSLTVNFTLFLLGVVIYFLLPIKYHFHSLHLVVVLCITSINARKCEDHVMKIWLLNTCGFMILLVGAFPITILLTSLENYLIFKIPYTIVFAIFLLHNFNTFLGKPRFFIPEEKDDCSSSDLLSKLTEALEKQKLYKRHALTISEFSKAIDEPVYKISRTLNQHYGKSFPELINHLRISEIKEELVKNDNQTTKIESLAYEAGFNAPSSFYVAFKKELGLTPKEYKNRSSESHR